MMYCWNAIGLQSVSLTKSKAVIGNYRTLLNGNSLDERLKYFDDPQFVAGLQPMPKAAEFLHALQKRCEVYICTSVPAKCAGARIASLISLFGFSPDHIIIGSEKNLLAADFMLDDNVENLKGVNVRYPVIFRQPWNEHVTGRPAVSTYDEFLTFVDLIKTEELSYEKGKKPKVVSLVGPSGSGKNYIAKHLLETRDFCRAVSYTTRKMKEHEADGQDYHFISKEEFFAKKKEQFFFETACYMGDYYGTAKKAVDEILMSGKNPLLILEVNGAIAIKQAYRNQAVNIFVKRSKYDCFLSVINRKLPDTETAKILSSIEDELQNEEFCDMTIENSDWQKICEVINDVV